MSKAVDIFSGILFVRTRHYDDVKKIVVLQGNKPERRFFEEQPQGEWIPIKMRPGTDEEYEEFSLYGDCPREDFRVFECPLPDDDQEVLVTTRWGDVCIDTWHGDVDCCYFEDNCDDDDVIAWMPLPEGYKKEGESDADS